MHHRRRALEQRCNRGGAFASSPHRSEQPVFFRCPRRPRNSHFFTFFDDALAPRQLPAKHTTGAGPERPPVGSIAPCQEKLVFGALNRTIEADESGQEWKQSHQRPDQGPTFGDGGGSNPSAEGDDAYRD